jgi:hypothetical protein
MNSNDIKQLIFDAVHENRQSAKPVRREKRSGSFSKKVMAFSCIIYAGTWLTCIVSWFWLGVFPEELKAMATWLFGATFAFYEAKSCIENKSKIEHPNNGTEF